MRNTSNSNSTSNSTSTSNNNNNNTNNNNIHSGSRRRLLQTVPPSRAVSHVPKEERGNSEGIAREVCAWPPPTQGWGARVCDRTRWSPLGELFLRPRRSIARGPSLSDCQKPNPGLRMDGLTGVWPEHLPPGFAYHIYIYIYIWCVIGNIITIVI